MLRWQLTAAFAVALAVVVAGPAPAAWAADHSHVIVGLTYVPGDTGCKQGAGACVSTAPPETVAPGDTLSFTNHDPVQHTVTSDVLGLFDSGYIATGASAVISTAGLAPGTYYYYCKVHTAAFMHGAFTITA